MEATKSESISIVSFYSACVPLCKHDYIGPKSGHAFEQGQCIANRPTCWDLRFAGFCDRFAGLRSFCGQQWYEQRALLTQNMLSLNLPRFARHSPAHLGLKGFDGGKGLKGCRAQKLQNYRKSGLVVDIKSNDKERSVQQGNAQQFQFLWADLFFLGNSCQALLGFFFRSIFRSP